MPCNQFYKNKEQYVSEEERWRESFFSSHIHVSNLGRIKSNAKGKWRFLSQNLDKYGYPVFGCRVNGKIKTKTVHRVVAYSFLEKIEGKDQVNHKNGIKTDNRVENLEWVSGSENQLHARDLKLNKTRGETHHKAILTEDKVKEIYRSQRNCKELGLKYGVSASTISTIKNGQNWASVTNSKRKRMVKKKLYSINDVLYIFNSTDSGVSLAKKIGVTPVTISEIRNGRTWGNVTGKRYSK